ncbi:MAG TPA: FAD-dependent monooxygenase, partial [Woeseiaceae bacterium]|nr:FAD-dependent monooxygenase [Woeseiaceae bacterium]
MNRRFEILVAGGGITGLTLAALLGTGPASDRLSVRVVDANAPPRFDPKGDVSLRVSAISKGSSRLYASLGVWERVLAVRGCPFHAMRVWDARAEVGGTGTLRFDADEFALPELGFIVENVLLQQALLDVVERSGVEVSFGTPIRLLRSVNERFEVELENGVTARPEVVVGADGASSLVRGQARIGSFVRRYGQSAFVTHLRPEHDHRHIAWQRFLAEGPLALLPLEDGRVSVVWSTTPARADDAIEMSDGDLGELLTGASDRVLGWLAPAGP